MTYITVLGLVATALSMVTLLPQAYQCYRTKRTKDISLPSYIIMESGAALWLIYGILQKDFPIILANAIVVVVAFFIIFLKLKYK